MPHFAGNCSILGSGSEKEIEDWNSRIESGKEKEDRRELKWIHPKKLSHRKIEIIKTQTKTYKKHTFKTYFRRERRERKKREMYLAQMNATNLFQSDPSSAHSVGL